MNIKNRLPKPLLFCLKKIRAFPEDLPVIVNFLTQPTKTPTTFLERWGLVLSCYRISYFVKSPHMENEMIQVMAAIFALDPRVPGVIVEAGSYKGGSTAKLSRAAQLAQRRLVVFDSFEGIPDHKETHGKNIFGGDAYFPPGSYAGSLEEVKRNVGRFGALEVCEFKKGWFEKTMPKFKEKVGTAYIDVDLESSTRISLKYLYPLLIGGGMIFSQDGHLPWVIELLRDQKFWQQDVKLPKPAIPHLGKNKLVAISKPAP